MSRDLNGTSQGLERTASVPVTAAPFTVSFWVWVDSLSVGQVLWQLISSSTGDNWRVIFEASDDHLYFEMFPGIGNPTPTTAITSGSWHHACVIEASATSHVIVLDGAWAGRGTDTTSSTPSAINRLYLGSNQSVSDWQDGRTAELAIWNTALSQANVEALAAGDNPTTVAGANLLMYCPILGTDSPEPDSVGTYPLTLIGSPPQGATHPPVDAISSVGLLGQACL